MTRHACPGEDYCSRCARLIDAAEDERLGDHDPDGWAADREADRYERWMEGEGA